MTPHTPSVRTSPGVRRRLRTGLAAGVLAIGTLLSGVLLGIPAAPASADPVEADSVETTPDGLTEATAAASCWEVKQLTPEAPSGVYWIGTPALGAPQQFYCDQETDGGGWVLIGRGREGWSESNLGSGTAAQVRETVDGVAAFTPRQLPSETVEQLVNDEPISSLDDGVRLRRAKNTEGTAWQETTFKFESPRDSWSWQFGNRQRVADYRIDGTASYGGQTSSFGRDYSYNRVHTTNSKTEGWRAGFGYGPYVGGRNDDQSYLWAKNDSAGYARPFTQVYLRPKLMSEDIFAPIADAGTASRVAPAVVDGFALPQTWGVAGLGAGPTTTEGGNEVSALAEVGSTVFVGGNFTSVQRSARDTDPQQQSYLAAFDRDTGEWIPGFRPVFDNQVKALAALPDGRLAVGGDFGSVNGESRAGLAVLDAQTGALDPAFTGSIVNHLSGGTEMVRALDVQDGMLYVGGDFTHSTGGTQSREVYTRAAVRFAIADGTPDKGWNPEFNGTVMSLDASERGDRVYFAGFFSQSKGRIAKKGAALASGSTDLLPWTPVFAASGAERTSYQRAVREVGDRVWLGGSEHQLYSYSRDDFSLLSTTVGQDGGDFQAIASDGAAVYAGCHCFQTQYEGATTWPDVGTAWTAANAIYGSGAWSAETGQAIRSFNPILNTGRGAGAWALLVDSTGTLWQGGDYTSSTRTGYRKQWSGGFVRHGRLDSTAPTAPVALTVSAEGQGVSLSWQPASDDSGGVAYEVLRDDRVVARVDGTSATLASSSEDSRYFVRAVDARGNRSASTPVATLQGAVSSSDSRSDEADDEKGEDRPETKAQTEEETR